MTSQPKPISSWKFLTFVVLLVFFLATNCMVGELLVMQMSEDRTATSKAEDTIWAMTLTEDARLYNDKTATARQATENAKIATHKADMLTYDAQRRSLTETAQAPKPPVITATPTTVAVIRLII